MKKYRFKAMIQEGDGGGAYVLFPYDVQEEFSTRGRVPIKAVLGGVPYRGSLIKYGLPQHMLPVLKAIRQQTGKDVGDTLQVEIWKDDQARTVEVPAPFEALLNESGLLEYFESLSYTHRKEYCRWISEAKKEETRSARLQKALEMLKKKVKTPG